MRSEHGAATGSDGGDRADGTENSLRAGGDIPDPETLTADAAVLTAAGARITPVGADKLPVGKWGHRVHADLPTADQIASMVADPLTRGWAILCGNHDTRIAVWDFEGPGLQQLAYARFVYDRAPEQCKYRTLSGAHIVVRIIDGPALRTEKLAYADTGDPDPEKRWELLAEVRGASDPASKRAGAYAQVTGPGRPALRPDFTPWVMTAEQADVLLAPLRAACQRAAWKQQQAAQRPARTSTGYRASGATTAEIITDAVASGALSVLDVLPDGWAEVSSSGERITIGRPGGKSAVSGNVLGGVYVIHSSAVPWADPSEPMPAAQVLARSRHDGNHAAAMKAVEDAAAGDPSPYGHWPATVLRDVADNRGRQREEYIAAEQAKVTAWEASLTTGDSAPAGESDSPTSDVDTGESDPPPNTWQRQPLDDVLDGTYLPEVADLLTRDDGIGLLYRGRVHSIHAPSESLKSMIVQYEAAGLLNAGEQVLYLDFESDRASVARRLIDLGADPQAVRARFDYRHPEVAPAVGTDEAGEWAALLGNDYGLAVIDGVTEAMDVLAPRGSGVDINERIASWLRRYPALLARRTGAAVALIDHVVKNSEAQGRHAIGGQHKLAGLDGAAYTVEVREQPRRGHRGEVHLYVAKDRPGGVRPHCGPMRPDRTQLAAVVTVDSTGERIAVTVAAPRIEAESGSATFRPTFLMERVSRWMQAHPGAHSRSEIVDAVTGKKSALRTALDVLAAEGYITTEEHARGTITQRNHTFVRLFTEVDDTPEEPEDPKPVPPVPNRSQTGPGTDTPQTGPTGPTPLHRGPVDGTGIGLVPEHEQNIQTGPAGAPGSDDEGAPGPRCRKCKTTFGVDPATGMCGNCETDDWRKTNHRNDEGELTA